MNIDSKTSPRHWRVEDVLGHLNDNVDKNNAEELLHCILTSTDILTWNLQGDRIYVEQRTEYMWNKYCRSFAIYIHTYIHTLLCSSKRVFNTNLHGMVIKKQG